MAAAVVLVVADSALALEIQASALAAAQEAGNAFGFAAAKVLGCFVHLPRGDLVDAIADGTEAVDAREAYELLIGPPYAYAFLANALMGAGDVDGAQRALDRAGALEVPPSAHWDWFLDSRACLRALRGDLRGALSETLECGRRLEAVDGHNPAWIPWRSRAALCLVGLGEEPERARALVEEEVELAEAFGAPRALGRALRLRGLVVGGTAGLGSLRDAVDVLEGSSARLELAHALCDLGAGLRRSGERQAAREPLGRSRQLAHACGAAGLEERALQELLASGARPRQLPATGADALTPSERRVAAMAVGGLANREIAQSLFVSLKTVEMHLGRAYRKLGVRSRAELPAALAAEPGRRDDRAPASS